jgi:hypothetical protein
MMGLLLLLLLVTPRFFFTHAAGMPYQ